MDTAAPLCELLEVDCTRDPPRPLQQRLVNAVRVDRGRKEG